MIEVTYIDTCAYFVTTIAVIFVRLLGYCRVVHGSDRPMGPARLFMIFGVSGRVQNPHSHDFFKKT